MSAQAAGRERLAGRHLTRALSLNPRFSPLHAREARETLRKSD
jgi:hypothetical protein